MTEHCWLQITDDASLRSLEVPVLEPDTKSHTVKDGEVWGFRARRVVSAAFAKDGLYCLLVVEF